MPCDCVAFLFKSDKLQVVKRNNFEQRGEEHIAGPVAIVARADCMCRAQQGFIAIPIGR